MNLLTTHNELLYDMNLFRLSSKTFDVSTFEVLRSKLLPNDQLTIICEIELDVFRNVMEKEKKVFLVKC